MRKSELIDKVAQQTGLPKVDIILTLETSLKTIKDSLAKEESVFLRGFGTFQTKTRKEKKARIIKKNIEIIVPEHKVPFFKPSKRFTQKLNSSLKSDNIS